LVSLWDRLPLPEHHVVGLVAGAALDRLTPTRLPGWTRPTGLVLGVAGALLNGAAVRAWNGQELDRPTRLVRRGPYAWTRNPMYLGWSMIHLGTAFLLRSPGMAVTWPIAVATISGEIRREEAQLAARFGAEFTGYAAAVPRYLGRGSAASLIRSARARARTRRRRSGMSRRA
jgi:protein-S-isoprenylcysteine O-methyltransferase Ste14